MSIIEQVKFSSSIKFFEKDFCNKWNLKPYFDINKPCFFMGVYSNIDVDFINNHKGFKVVGHTSYIRDCFFDIHIGDDIVVKYSFVGKEIYENLLNRYRLKCVNIGMKDHSQFKPTILGEKIYFYTNQPRKMQYYGYPIIEEIKNKIDYEIIEGYQGNSIEYVRENYYNNCFLNIKPSIWGGNVSATELAHMGRMTISNIDAPFCIRYNDIDDILKIIKDESKKIGTIQERVAEETKKIFIDSDEWLNVDFWLK